MPKQSLAKDTRQHLAHLIQQWMLVPSNARRKVSAQELHDELSGNKNYLWNSVDSLGRAINRLEPRTGVEFFKIKGRGHAVYVFCQTNLESLPAAASDASQ